MSKVEQPQTQPGEPAAGLPQWGLFVCEPYAARIVAGLKTWEMRKRLTDRRGRIAILSERGVVGTAELCDVAGPFGVQGLAMHVDKHRTPLTLLDRYAAGQPLYAWVLRGAVRFDKPMVYRPGRGPVVWFRLDKNVPDQSRRG